MRALLFILILILVLEQLWLPLIPLLLWYGLRYTTYELIVIAVLIDGYVGTFYSWPLYTILVTTSVLFLEWLRPRIMFHTN